MTTARQLGAPIAAALLLIVTVVVPACGSDEEKAKPQPADKSPRTVRAELTLEQSARPDTGETELLISLQRDGPRLNRPETTGGARSVRLRCFDRNGAVTIRQPTAWPLAEEAGYPYPHIHHSADQRVLDGIRSCRLTGPGVDFRGEVSGRLPVATQ